MFDPLDRSVANFRQPEGTSLDQRHGDFSSWLDTRRSTGVWPFSRTMQGSTSSRAMIGDEHGQHCVDCLNFSSQDYLALAQHPQVHEAAIEAIRTWGIHSAGSPVLVGRTSPMVELEKRLAETFESEACSIFATGWAAGFGVLTGLARPGDFVVLDAIVHNCLGEGAAHSGARVVRYRHNDMDDLESKLLSIRRDNSRCGVFVVSESLFSMDSDSPDLAALVQLCQKFDSISILDVAHDFGAVGNGGLGLWGTVAPNQRPDIVMGSFSKTFASNGGFIVANAATINYLRAFATSWVFSNAQSPVQAAIALKCLEICRSQEGEARRSQLMSNSMQFRESFHSAGFEVAGLPSPIVPVYVGNGRLARLISREIMKLGLAANLAEFPGVPIDRPRFRFQLMNSHSKEDIIEAAKIMSKARDLALSLES